MISICLSIAALLVVCSTIVSSLREDEYRAHFVNFTRAYGKTYTAAQMFEKYETFKLAHDEMTAHNSNPNRTFTKGINHLSDLTAAEFAALKGYKKPTELSISFPTIIYNPNNILIPIVTGVTFDWRSHNPSPVTAVKDQGQCGSCWAFSATGVTEGAYARKYNIAAVPLSESNLVDCDTASQSGCNGGHVYNALGYIKTNNGICTESAYPYHATHATCAASHCTKSSSTLTSVSQVYSSYLFTYPATQSTTHISAASEADIISRLANGPVGVAVEADQAAWQAYHGGIVTTATTCGSSLDHAVLITGYGTDPISHIPYWIIKNSWSTSWGESGYIRVQRGVGLCGIGINYFFAQA